jgi:ABC-type transport system involved in multi-copper enzyme maturation permease subunit
VINLMRADFYRLRHSRALLIWEILIGGVTAVKTIDWGLKRNLTGWLAVRLVNNSASLFIWLLPLVMMVVGHDFSQGLLKDTLTIGISRRRYFLSKMATMGLITLLQLLMVQLIAFLGGVIFGGAGPVQWADWLAQLLVYVVIAFTEVTTITLVLYWRGSTTAALAVGFLALLAISILHVQFGHISLFAYTDWMLAINRLTTVHSNTLGAMMKPVIGAAALVIGGGIVNGLRFEKMSL